ncbi:MAG TPA: cobalamin-independent methionine synthase II family protein [Stellaceae bacterium]|jgi:5-methyltetrahydropteroyltriglutamate--homocysteine methyltransferase|nr:cobalamin-independent methionine synthase II family protein [Stellaceae bacterium]
MRHSTNRILTTHAGSLPRPDALREAWAKPGASPAEIDALLKTAVADVVKAQQAAAVDIPNDGEFGKPMRAAADLAAWGTYIFGRLSGFGQTPAGAAAPDRAKPGQPMRIVGERWEQREFADFYAANFYAAGAGVPSVASRPACIGPIAYSGEAAVKRDLADLKAAADAAGIKEAFVTSIAVGSLEMFCRGQDAHYKRAEDFLDAIAKALAVEYRAIVDAGFLLQLDDPGLPDTWDMLDPHPTLEQYKSYALLRIEALNQALAGIPEDRVRYHICWGSWHGPHTADLPLKDIADVMLRVKAQAFSVEAGNVRHEHEYKLWRDAKLPDGKILIPGVVSHATNVVEHPELVADRILNYARVVGRENVIAGTDCGLGGRVHPQIAWAKLKALADGARLASQELWR